MNPLRLFKPARIDTAARAGIEVVLHADRPLRLSNARGRRIRCTAGCVWLTAPGLAADVFLHVDDTWEIGTDGLVLIEAVGSATVAIRAAGNQSITPST